MQLFKLIRLCAPPLRHSVIETKEPTKQLVQFLPKLFEQMGDHCLIYALVKPEQLLIDLLGNREGLELPSPTILSLACA